jgi:transposase-like protein
MFIYTEELINQVTINFYLSKKRDLKAARKFLLECIKLQGKPEKITIDKSGANTAAVDSINDKLKNKDRIEKRTSKYLNNPIEQDHRKSNKNAPRY